MPSALTADEHGALGTLVDAVACERVRLYRPGERGRAGAVRAIVLALSGDRAVALGNAVFLPDAQAADLPVLAHELVHCAQYQRWGALRYAVCGALEQGRDLAHRLLGIGASPYHYAIEHGRQFEAYGMEQQGQIVEDCYRGNTAARALCPYGPGDRQPRRGPAVVSAPRSPRS